MAVNLEFLHFVSGHDFSRADDNGWNYRGFSPCFPALRLRTELEFVHCGVWLSACRRASPGVAPAEEAEKTSNPAADERG
jgi:hypothetical protein